MVILIFIFRKTKRKLQIKEDEDNLEEEYENSGDIGSSLKRTRHLLPIKSDGAIVRRAVLEDSKFLLSSKLILLFFDVKLPKF